MLPDLPFPPVNTLFFKNKVGGANIAPTSKNQLDKSILNPKLPVQQAKNAMGGEGYVTDEVAKQRAAAEAVAGSQPLPNTQAASMAGFVQAQQDLIQKEASKKSIRKTIFAGETGGFSGGKSYGSAATGMAGRAF